MTLKLQQFLLIIKRMRRWYTDYDTIQTVFWPWNLYNKICSMLSIILWRNNEAVRLRKSSTVITTIFINPKIHITNPNIRITTPNIRISNLNIRNNISISVRYIYTIYRSTTRFQRVFSSIYSEKRWFILPLKIDVKDPCTICCPSFEWRC